MPRITVLLPVYNGLPYLRQAVDSLLCQSFGDFVLHIVNDGSTDETAKYLDSLTDPRIQITHQDNAGLAITLNRMIHAADTEFIARMDADDVCLAQRFERQVEFLDQHPDVAVVGTRQGYVQGTNNLAQLRLFGKTITPGYSPPMANPPYWHPADDGHILVHSSVMMRTEIIRNVGGYPEIVPGQDLALWYRLADHDIKIAHLDEMLLLIRITPGGISSKNLSRQYHTWRHISDCWKRKCKGLPTLTLSEYMASHPLTAHQLGELESKSRLRNALAHVLNGNMIKGLSALIIAIIRNPKIFLHKIKSRI